LIKNFRRISELQVRKAKEKDLDIIVQIIKNEIYPELSFAEMKKWIKSLGWPPNPYVQWFVLEENGEIIGTMRWEVFDRYDERLILMSSWIAIKREYQHQGYGSYLWQKSKNILNEYWRSKGCKIVLIFTETEMENPSACNFYRKMLGNDLIEVKMPKIWWPKNNVIWFFKEERDKLGHQ